MPSRQFHLGDILSISHDRLVSPRGMAGIYEILDFMTGDNLFTHQLPRASRECKSHILAQLPWLNSPEIEREVNELGDTIDSMTDRSRSETDEIVTRWLAEMVLSHSETHPVEPIPASDHARIDPVSEAEMMAPGKVIVIQVN